MPVGEGNETTEKTKPITVTLLWPAILLLPEPVCTKEVKSHNKNMKVLMQSNCNGLQIRFKGPLWGFIQSYDPRKSSSLKQCKGKYIEILAGFIFLFLRRFIYTLP